MFSILLVDDDADIRKIVKKILDKGGYNVVTVDNGFSGLDELNNRTYDLALIDATMPQYSGFDLIRAIRRQPRHRNLTIAMLTGRREKRDIEQAIELAVDDYIVKPINPEVLLGKIEKILQEKRMMLPVFDFTFNKAAQVDFPAALETPLRMTKIGLTGFTGLSPQNLAIGVEFSLNIKNLGLAKMPWVKITSSGADPHNPSQYIVEGFFMEIDEEFKKIIAKCMSKYQEAA